MRLLPLLFALSVPLFLSILLFPLDRSVLLVIFVAGTAATPKSNRSTTITSTDTPLALAIKALIATIPTNKFYINGTWTDLIINKYTETGNEHGRVHTILMPRSKRRRIPCITGLLYPRSRSLISTELGSPLQAAIPESCRWWILEYPINTRDVGTGF